jgi:hypothetical protein
MEQAEDLAGTNNTPKLQSSSIRRSEQSTNSFVGAIQSTIVYANELGCVRVYNTYYSTIFPETNQISSRNMWDR